MDSEVIAKGLLTKEFTTPSSLSDQLESVIKEVSDKIGQKKKATVHSKPFWTPELARLSQELITARERYQERNTGDNRLNLDKARYDFDETRKAECRTFILNKTKDLNAAEANQFWKECNKIFNPKTQNSIESLLKNDVLVTEKEKIEKILFSTFFEGLHLKEAESSFDDEFHSEVNEMYNKIKKNDFEHPTSGNSENYIPDNIEPVQRDGTIR